jgi:hypothetical protein
MSRGGCTFCIDAGADFDWCRVCGRGLPDAASEMPEPAPAPILKAIRKARGHLTGPEVVQATLATHPPDCDCGKHGRADSTRED